MTGAVAAWAASERTVDRAMTAHASPEFDTVRRVWVEGGRTPEHAARILLQVTDAPDSLEPVRHLKREIAERGAATEGAVVERYLIVSAALSRMGQPDGVRCGPAVEALLRAEFRFYAHPPRETWGAFEAGTPTFAAMSQIVTGRRFPAGQFDWTISGIRRSDLLRVRWTDLPKTLTFAALRMKGLWPVFFSHLSWRRPGRSLSEIEANRSYYRMATAMACQPAIVGFGACSWFRSPGTHRVSPHLAWLSRVFLENGGHVVEAGPADPDCGVLHKSRTRRELFERGEFRPTKGLVMWPRTAMLAWADAHPELADPPGAA